MNDIVLLTADDEEPICSRCDNNDYEHICYNMCGAKKGWQGYERAVVIKEEKQR